jgi:ATP-dependent DNA helicase Rep
MLSACSRSSVLTALQPRAANALRDFARIQTQLQNDAATRSPGDLAELAIKQLGYLEWLQLGSKDPAVVQRRKELLQEFIAWLKQFAKGRGLDALNAALIQISLSGKDDQSQNAVRLMTLHAAKGLEFNHVYIIGMDEGTFPHESALSEGRLEEERRLLYVGITRARKKLALCYPLFRTRYGEALRCDPSRFIAELPEQTLDADYRREGEAAISAAEDASKKLANNHLAALRALMSQ